MKHIGVAFFQLIFWAMVFAMCDNPNGRDLWDAAIDYVDNQAPKAPQTLYYPCNEVIIKHNSEIK